MRYPRIEDLLRLALRMQGRADGISLRDIEGAFEVSRRTAERMRDALLRVFPQIEEIGEPGREKRWRLPPGAVGRMADPRLDDLLALHRAKALCRREGDLETAGQLADLSDRLHAAFDANARRRIDTDAAALLEADGVALRPGPRETLDAEIIETLRQAILAGVWINADHRARASGKLSRDGWLGPLGILLGEGRQYLVAWSEYQEDVRLFALAGFERVELSDEVFERPKGFDLASYARRSLGVFQEEPQEIVWRFRQGAAEEAAGFLFHPGQRLESQPDGSLVVRFHAGGLHEMAWHLFRWGDQAEVLAPPALKREYEFLLRQALSTLIET